MVSIGESSSSGERTELARAHHLIEQLSARVAELEALNEGFGLPTSAQTRSTGVAGESEGVVDHVPGTCTACGKDLGRINSVGTDVVQILDLPEIRVVAIEHVAERRKCSCGSETSGELPEFALDGAGYGPGIRALASYLSAYQHLPIDRIAQIFSDVLGHDISEESLRRIVSGTSYLGSRGDA